MKHILFFLLLCSTASVSAQIDWHLDVEGNARMLGKLDMHQADDTTSVYLGHEVGKLAMGNGSNKRNTMMGSYAGQVNIHGTRNSFFGYNAGSITTGGQNSNFGSHAGWRNTSGGRNSFFGTGAGYDNTTGSENVFLGRYTGQEINGNGNVFIGNNAGPNSLGDDLDSIDNRLYIHNDDTPDPLIYGEFDNRKIGINTGNPEAALHVGGTGTASSILLNNGGNLSWKNNSGAIRDVLTVDTDNDTYLDAYDDLKFRSGPSNTLRMLIRPDGKIGIGITNPSFALDVVGRIRGTEVYCGGVNACSDARFKRDFTALQSPLSLLNQLNGYYHYWKQDDYPEWNFPSDRQIGFKAQELQEVLPELVSEMPDGMLAVDYAKLVPVLVEAIKDLSRQNEQQNQLLEDHRTEMSELRALIEADGLGKDLSSNESSER